ncbi:hypothetical protein GCM10007973_08550 [Polymorphobacter multimanifer]|uniref:baseplate J/gp47 family protein n=1 Tax=Polymorphobacter multimanifer TaxID=1070431 RepID=UPI001668F859|nr:baseplate J/gp47 family protein [Polymorphobacter multimanifer]GGI74017.1 hypothetical protein GCM10007973_08550 [Polymorphobacter multimanifer]
MRSWSPPAPPARALCPEWTDLSVGDPGAALIDVFAFLTEALLYRVNRIPPRLQLALLNLAGVQMRPPAAAVVELLFTRRAESKGRIEIPAGTRVATGDASVAFTLVDMVVLGDGDAEARGTALHCELVENEALGRSSNSGSGGGGGQLFRLARAPVVRGLPDGRDFMLGVETDDDLSPGRALRAVDGRVFEIWREVAHMADTAAGEPVYLLDRGAGVVQFGQGSSGAAPLPDRQLRAWYRRGGGAAGNVAAGTLTSIAAVPQVQVTNPEAARGGADAETIEQLLRRAPSAMAARDVAVTVRDYEEVVLEPGGISRALAFAQAQVWRHAAPGVVEVLAVPSIDADAHPGPGIPAEVAASPRTEAVRARAEAALGRRRPLGVRATVRWAKVRPVSVPARVVIGPEADPAAVEHGIYRRIHAFLSPLRELAFGRQIRASEVYERILGEPGVRYADQLVFRIDETPHRNVCDLRAAPAQPGLWFAVTDVALHRSEDDGDSWSVLHLQEGEAPRFVRRHPTRPGLLALGIARGTGSVVHLSRDLGETWSLDAAAIDGELSDAAWLEQDGQPALLLATSTGLLHFAPGSDKVPAPVVVDPAQDAKGFWAVATATSSSGLVHVAVAARARGGVYVSPAGGVSNSYLAPGLKDHDVRVLGVHATGSRLFLWATMAAEAGEEGHGAQRLELRADGARDPAGWVEFREGWRGGSAQALSFAGNLVIAGSNRAGVLTLDVDAAAPAWVPARLDAGLPLLSERRLLHEVRAVAAARRPDGLVILSGGIRGIHASLDGGQSYTLASAIEYRERVPLPPRWLYCSGEHRLVIVQDGGG